MAYTKKDFIVETAKDIYIKYDLKTNPPVVVAKKAIEYAEILARELEEKNYFATSTINIEEG